MPNNPNAYTPDRSYSLAMNYVDGRTPFTTGYPYAHNNPVDLNIVRSSVRLLRSVKKHLPEVFPIIAADERNHYLAYSEDIDGLVSYAPAPHLIYNQAQRIRTTFARYLSRRLKLDVNRWQKQCEAIAADGGFKANDFVIRNDVATVYRMLADNGFDRNSCMRDNPDGCLAFYEINRVPVLVYNERARALLWTLDDGRRFLDRIYPNEGSHIPHYRQYCKMNGIILRNHNYLPDGGELNETVSVTLDGSETGIPYLDTLRFVDVQSDRTALRFSNVRYACAIECNWTDGATFDDEEGEYSNCDHCGSRYYSDDGHEVSGRHFCDPCYSDSSVVFYCEHCEENYLADNVDTEEVHTTYGTQYWCRDCAENDAYECNGCNEFFRNVPRIRETQENETYCDSCIDEYATQCVDCCEYTSDLYYATDDENKEYPRCVNCDNDYQPEPDENETSESERETTNVSE